MSPAKVIPFATSAETTSTMARYRKAYQTAERAAEFAETVKFVGGLLAGVIFIVALLVYQSSPMERSGFPVASAWLIAGAVLAILACRLWSMVFRVQAWMLETTIDAAVNSSPLLSDEQRTRALSWGNDVAIREESAA